MTTTKFKAAVLSKSKAKAALIHHLSRTTGACAFNRKNKSSLDRKMVKKTTFKVFKEPVNFCYHHHWFLKPINPGLKLKAVFRGYSSFTLLFSLWALRLGIWPLMFCLVKKYELIFQQLIF